MLQIDAFVNYKEQISMKYRGSLIYLLRKGLTDYAYFKAYIKYTKSKILNESGKQSLGKYISTIVPPGLCNTRAQATF